MVLNTTTAIPTANQVSCDKYPVTDTVYNINASITLVLSILTVFGNSTMILIYALNVRTRTLNNSIIVLLAASDLLRGTVVMITKTVNHFMKNEYLPPSLCTITACSSAFTFFFNPMILALIAIVRYFIIVPWTRRAYFLTRSKVRVALMVIFSISVLFAVLPYISSHIGVYKFSIYHGVCFTDWSTKNRPFRSIFYIFVVGVAFPVLTVCYAKLFLVLKRHNDRMREKQISSKSLALSHLPSVKHRSVSAVFMNDIPKANTIHQQEKDRNISLKKIDGLTNIGVSSLPHTEICDSTFVHADVNINQTERNVADKQFNRISVKVRTTATVTIKTKRSHSMFGQSLSKQEYRMTKTMIFIFIAYIICWFPAALVNILALISTCNVPGVWYFIIVTMVELKSVLNPILYGYGNREYQKILKGYLRKYILCKEK